MSEPISANEFLEMDARARNGRRRIVLVQGAFEILHGGHIKLLKFAKEQGDYLIVALNSDKLLVKYKGRQPVMPWDHKKEVLEGIRYVDEVVEAGAFSPILLLSRHKVSVFVVADEWLSTKSAEIAYMNHKGGHVVVAPRFSEFSTTEIRKRLLDEALNDALSRPCPVGGELSNADTGARP
jgi:glycerol-3-phosphate cytidylyltransferase